MSKPARPPGQGAPPFGQRRIGVGRVDHARQVADQRLQRLAQFCKSLRQVARQRAARDRPPMAITPLRRNSARSVAVSTITSATRPEK